MASRGTPDKLTPAELRAWQGFLRARARIGRVLEADLDRSHSLSGNDYDVLIQLGLAPGRRLRMTALAEQVLMSPSGVSRLVDDLERLGLVARERSETDARSFDVVLTPEGRKRLKAANRTHLKRVRELFLDQLSDEQLEQLAGIWDALEPPVQGDPMPGITDKVVAITGASSGIGAATALLLAERGAKVVLGARRTERLDELAGQIRAGGGHASACSIDVTVANDLVRFVGQAVDEFGRLDVLVGNAGVARIAPVASLDVDDWSAMIDVNLRGVLNGIAAAMPVFRRQGRGHLVTTVSTSGIKIVPGQAVYAGTKNAVRTLLEALRQESTDGVLRTTSISPGYVRTELTDYIEDPAARAEAQQRMAELGIAPEAVARAIAFAIEQPDDVEIGDMTIRPTIQG